MNTTRSALVLETLTPFLYPGIHRYLTGAREAIYRCPRLRRCGQSQRLTTQSSSATATLPGLEENTDEQENHLNPSPSSYSITPFTDRCSVKISAGAGGHGCVSFLREKFIEHGPPNGGDGGSGGNVYIQAVRGETSLHKLARRGAIKAGRGKNGQGKNKGGERGEDLLFTVPVGTVVREVWRQDPVEAAQKALLAAQRADDPSMAQQAELAGKQKWLTHPGLSKADLANIELPKKARVKESSIAGAQPEAPLRLDLDKPMERPLLLAVGAGGGLGNPNFISKNLLRPHYATKGDEGLSIMLELELKVLADVGLVGLPNAGKSTLLRALTNSRTRVGDWAFTTLQPSIGTVVLDDNKGRPALRSYYRDGEVRTNFTVADIPGLIEDAHRDKGLGLGFLRHVERAAVLAFVVDLSAGDAVKAVKSLWKEVAEFDILRDKEISAETEEILATERLQGGPRRALPTLMPPVSSKPWFVVATKADLPETRANYAALQTYVQLVQEGSLEHPSGKKNAWKKKLTAVPISAIRAEGVERIPKLVVELLE